MVQPRGRSSTAVLQGCESLLKISKKNLIVDALAKVLSPRSDPKVIQRRYYPVFSKTRRSERRSPLSYKTKMLIRVHTMSCVMCRAQDLSLIHISEPTRLGMISYAVFCLKKKK